MLSSPGSPGGLETESIIIGLELAAAATGTTPTAAAAAPATASMAAAAAARGLRQITAKLQSGDFCGQYRNITFPSAGATGTSFVNGQVTRLLTGGPAQVRRVAPADPG